MELPNKKNILFVDKIHLFNLILFIFFRIYFDKIFFLRINRLLRYKKLLLLFEIIGLNWINHNHYSLEKASSKTIKCTRFLDKYAAYISKKIWFNSLSTFFINKNLFTACLGAKIQPKIEDIYEIMEVAQIFKKKNQVYLMITNNFFFETINKDYNFKNINFINYEIFKISGFIFSTFLNTCLIIFKKITSISFDKKEKKYQKFKKNKFTVAFFPQKGMFVQNKVKDHFYLKKNNSNFNKKNIAHIEWNNFDLAEQSKKYYLKKKIAVFFWDSFKKKSPITVIKFFIFKFNFLFKLYKYSILIEILSSAYQVDNSRNKIINNFPQLKYVLAGYELLFPAEISVACAHLNIKTIATQERLMHPVWSPMLCFDYYFSLGPMSNKFLKKRMNKTVKNIIKTTISTTDAFKIKKNEKYKNNLKCLIVDFSSLRDEDWYSSGRSVLGNWQTNCNFYYNILSCAKKYPNIFFLIKSKNYLWLKVNYFKVLVKDLNKQKNIKVLSDKKKWTPDYSIKYTDFAITRYSSLSDQMFYLNKPILISNDHGYPGEVYDFGNKILVNNLNQLENKINLIQKNYSSYNNSLNKIRKTLFYYNIKKNSIKNLLTFFDKKLNMK